MAVTVAWDNDEKTILRYSVTGTWDFQEFYSVIGEGRKMLQSVDHAVSVIQDFSGTNHFPPSMITHARTIVGSRPEKVGFVVFVASSIFVHTIYKIASKIIPNLTERYSIVNTNVEALQLIKDWQAKQDTVAN